MKSIGLTQKKVLPNASPVLFVAVLGWAATSYVIIWAVPDANQTFRELTYRIAAQRHRAGEAGETVTLGDVLLAVDPRRVGDARRVHAVPVLEAEVEAACLSVPVEEVFASGAGTVRVFPNPTKGIIQFWEIGPAPVNISIRNALGSLVHSRLITEGEQIDLTVLPAGLYFLELRKDQKVAVLRVVKE